MKIWPENEAYVSSGFYIIEVNHKQLCKGFNCEIIINENTKATINKPWNLNVENDYCNKSYFIGPLTWKSSKLVVEDLLK